MEKSLLRNSKILNKHSFSIYLRKEVSYLSYLFLLINSKEGGVWDDGILENPINIFKVIYFLLQLQTSNELISYF
jgi:hypothetical protein